MNEEKSNRIDNENLVNSIKNDLIVDLLFRVVLNYAGEVNFEGTI